MQIFQPFQWEKQLYITGHSFRKQLLCGQWCDLMALGCKNFVKASNHPRFTSLTWPHLQATFFLLPACQGERRKVWSLNDKKWVIEWRCKESTVGLSLTHSKRHSCDSVCYHFCPEVNLLQLLANQINLCGCVVKSGQAEQYADVPHAIAHAPVKVLKLICIDTSLVTSQSRLWHSVKCLLQWGFCWKLHGLHSLT